MSLRVWLPLNGDLHNQGTSNYTISIFRGAETYDNNGKIGKCFYAHGTNTLKILNILPDIYNYSAYSLCVWCYIEAQNTSHSGSGIISGGNWNSQLLNLAMSDWSSDHYTKLRISGSNWNRTYNYNFYKNTWYHIVVCDDGTHTYGYVNGALIGDTATSFLPTSIEGTDICIGGATYYSGMQFFGKINDVRIYDHCLSAAEVKEIAQGLVLHYKLDGITNGIIQDSSGYNHNGTIVGDFILNSETKRYSYSTKWNSSSPTTSNETGICYIQTPITLTTPLQMSITWWAKPENGYGGSTGHGALCTSTNTSQPTDYNTTAFHHRDSGFDIYPSDASGVKRLSFTYTKNEWHHYALTYDGTTARAYQDGIEKTTVTVGTNKTLATFTQLYIGYSQAGGVNRKTLGSYSDFRIYCTALSPDDILALYHTGAKIDNLQNTHTFEYIEDQSSIKVTKQGQIKCDEIIEDTNVKIKKDNTIEAFKFIEL